ncbi:hypothetical protein AVBRAN12654_09385, partial [Campylobacter sp. RM12654]|nr:hypothetical protein [Campylobacter sp. RM12654]
GADGQVTAAAVADKHTFYTNKAADLKGENGEVAADFSLAATWKGGNATAGQAGTGAIGSVLNAKNNFDDIQAAHYEQDARLAADGYLKAKSAIQTDGTIKFETGVAGGKLKAAAIGALNVEANAAQNNGAAKEVSDALTALQVDNLKLEDANKLIDNAVSKLQVFVDAAKGKTMDKAEAEDGIAAHAMIQFLKGVKEGINEPNREGLKEMIGLTNDTKTNF